MSKIHIEPKYADVKPSGEYVYIHHTLDTNMPFYVGKGVDRRAFDGNRNPFWKYRARKHGIRVDICQDGMSTDDALLLEMWLIAKLRHEGHDLCNMTDGGEGRIGFESEKRRPVYCSNGKEFTHAEAAAEWLRSVGNPGATSKIVSACALRRKRSIYGYGFSHTKNVPIPVVTGKEAQGSNPNRIEVFSSDGFGYRSASEAQLIVTGREGSGVHILQACRGIRHTAYGLTWSFSPSGPFEEYVDPKHRSNRAKWKRVRSSEGDVFESFTLAAEWLSYRNGRTYSQGAIQASIRRGGKCGGLYWYRLDKKKGE